MSWLLAKVVRLIMPSDSSSSSAINENAQDVMTANPNSENLEVVQRKTVSVPLPLPEDIVILILSFVPVADLLHDCVFVKEWSHLIAGQNLWHIKCEKEGKPIPRVDRALIPRNFYRAVYFVPYGENLIKNPSGENTFSDWEAAVEEDDWYVQGNLAFHGWIVENPPAGADPIPDSDSQSCFATTYFWCKKAQTIDLLSVVGGIEETLDKLKPHIEVSEWYAARYDCGSIYRLNVTLLDDKDNVIDSFKFEHTEPQWTGKRWEEVKYTFKDYPKGVRRLRFEHSGKDTQFWAGNFGSKTTKAKVSFVI